MGLRYLFVSDLVLEEWEQILIHKPKIRWKTSAGITLHDYWTEPEIPKDLKIIHSEYNKSTKKTKFTISSSIFDTVPDIIPEIDIRIQLGTKPKQIFIFR